MDMRDEIYLAIGEASTCWSCLDKAGVYDSRKAKNISDHLSKIVENEIRKARIEVLQDYINLGPENAKRLLKLIETKI